MLNCIQFNKSSSINCLRVGINSKQRIKKYARYRYDTETGLYYLQSRYYNPEWGRFINSDGVVGQTGELLGHNMFAYCKNNAVNMSDSNGDRPEFSGTGHDTGEDNAISLAIMNHRYDYSSGTIIPRDSGRVEAASTPNTNLAGAIWGTAAGVVEHIKKQVVGAIGKDSVINLYPSTSIAQKIEPFAKGAKFAARAFTVVTGAFDIAHTWDPNVKLSLGQRIGKTAIQAAGIGIGIAVGACLSGPLLAAGMASGGILAIGGATFGAFAIDYTAATLVGCGQDAIYRKNGL